MANHINQLTLVVKDYDEAIAFYTQKLHFELIEDTVLNDTKRWVVVAPKKSQCRLLLTKAANDEQIKSVGNQTGGRVILFMKTNNFDGEYQNLVDNKTTIYRQTHTKNSSKQIAYKN